jgi:hypothetical protein
VWSSEKDKRKDEQGCLAIVEFKNWRVVESERDKIRAIVQHITCPHGAICMVMQGTANSLGWAEHLAREAGDGWVACDVPVLPDIPEPYSVCIRYFECSQPQRSQ